jgi:hypothetical protein
MNSTMRKLNNTRKYNYDFWEKATILVCALITILFGVGGLLAWVYGINDFHSFGKKFIPMDEESAILFLFMGASMAFIHWSLCYFDDC